MNCQQVERSLIAYLDMRAKPAERRQVQAHLGECAACRQRAEQFRLLWGALDEDSVPAISPSGGFDRTVLARVGEEVRPVSFWRAFVPSPRLAIASAVLIVLSALLSSISPSYEPVVSVASQGSEAEFGMIKDLPVLEDYDVLANFDALSELPTQAMTAQPERQQPRI